MISAAPYRKSADKRKKTKGCQIDLLIQTSHAMCLVEIKRKRNIGTEVIRQMEEKVRSINRPAGVSVRTALIYDGGLAQTISASGYFNSLIGISDLC